MTIEEIKKLTNTELGKQLDGEIDFDSRPEFRHVSYEGLVTSLDEIAKVEKIVIEKVTTQKYILFLVRTVGCGFTNHLSQLTLSNARQRAEASLLALQNKG